MFSKKLNHQRFSFASKWTHSMVCLKKRGLLLLHRLAKVLYARIFPFAPLSETPSNSRYPIILHEGFWDSPTFVHNNISPTP